MQRTRNTRKKEKKKKNTTNDTFSFAQDHLLVFLESEEINWIVIEIVTYVSKMALVGIDSKKVTVF